MGLLICVFVSPFLGDSCTPEVSLSARPGSLTVYVNISPSLVQDHGGHAKHRVYFGKEGESLEVRILVTLGGVQEIFMCLLSHLYCHLSLDRLQNYRLHNSDKMLDCQPQIKPEKCFMKVSLKCF